MIAPDLTVQLRAWIAKTGLSQEQFALRVLMRSPATLYRWLNGQSPVPKAVRDHLNRQKPPRTP